MLHDHLRLVLSKLLLVYISAKSAQAIVGILFLAILRPKYSAARVSAGSTELSRQAHRALHLQSLYILGFKYRALRPWGYLHDHGITAHFTPNKYVQLLLHQFQGTSRTSHLLSRTLHGDSFLTSDTFYSQGS